LFFLNRRATADFFEAVSNVTPHKAKPRAPMKVTSANKVFWVRPANAELDRSGEWLLRHLSTTRASALPRAGTV
jgi:hypothetical protein